MNIQRRMLIGVLVSIFLVLAISVSIVLTSGEINALQEQEDLAGSLVTGSYEITHLATDYLVNAEPRALFQLGQRYDAMNRTVAGLVGTTPGQEHDITAIRETNRQIGRLIAEMPAPDTGENGLPGFSPQVQRTTWSRMIIQTQELISASAHLRESYDQEMHAVQFRNTLLILALILVILLLISVNYVFINRRLMRSIGEINAGTAAFASGDLAYRIPDLPEDEIGGIGRRLNAMADEIRVVTTSRDELDREVLERRLAEEALRESEEKLRTILDATPFPVAVVDREDNNIQYWSRSAQTLFGHTAPTTPEWYMIAYPDPDYRQDVINRWKPFLVEARKSSKPVNTGEYRVTCRDGSVRICEIYATFIKDSLIVTFNDITERKYAEQEVLESQERFSTLVDQIPLGIVITRRNEQGETVLYYNRSFSAMTGYTLETVPTLDEWAVRAFPDPAYRLDRLQVIVQMYDEAGRMITSNPRVSRVTCSDGTEKEIEFRYTSLDVFGFWTLQDITGRMEAESQRETLIRELGQKNAELERFTYTVSHDLKSPLITIKGFLGLLREDAMAGNAHQLEDDIRRITSATDKMQLLLGDLLTLSRIGRVINPPERVNFGTIAEEAVELLAGMIEENSISVTIAPGLPDVLVDHARIREVLVNLVENAVKFRGDQPEPVVEIGALDREGETHFYVRDNGIGIEPQYLDRVFALFEKLDQKSEGTGIGLSIVRRIIEVHGGRIWTVSEGSGKGTTFFFTLPLADDTQFSEEAGG